jgi:hypothetical protein
VHNALHLHHLLTHCVVLLPARRREVANQQKKVIYNEDPDQVAQKVEYSIRNLRYGEGTPTFMERGAAVSTFIDGVVFIYSHRRPASYILTRT